MSSIHSFVAYFSLFVASCMLQSFVFAGKPAAPPPIYYHIQYFTGPGGSAPSIRAINSMGVMVGDYSDVNGTRGFLYDPAMTEAVDLNDLVDLSGAVAVAADWVISYAVDLNDRGAILATIEKVAQRDYQQPDYERHGVLIDTSQLPWSAIMLPDAASHVSMGMHINNNCDILGAFVQPGANVFGPAGAYLYNAGLYRDTGPDAGLTILPVTLKSRSAAELNEPISGYPLRIAGIDSNGNAFRYTVGNSSPVEVFAIEMNGGKPGINGYGAFCSRARVRKTKGSQYVSRPFWFDPDLYNSPTFIGSETAQAGQIACDMNDHGDVILTDYLYRNGTLLVIDNLVTGAYGDYWRTHLAGVNGGTKRTANGYPLLSGSASNETGGSWGVLLIPQTTPQP